VVFCLAFSYNVATHDYYQLQLIPIAALGIAPLVARLFNLAGSVWQNVPLRLAATAMFGVALALVASRAVSRANSPLQASEPAVAAEIGAFVNHSTRTIYLASDYGVPLEYHGRLSGAAWPIAADLEWEQLVGVAPAAAEDRFRTWYATNSPEYFIVADPLELARQPDLEQFLTRHFPLVAHTAAYSIFDLRHV
jgi:hypothetical protein